MLKVIFKHNTILFHFFSFLILIILMACEENKGVNPNPNPNEEELVFIHTFDSPGYSRKVFVEGNILYSASQDAGLVIWDVSNPASPDKLGSVVTDGFAYHVILNDNYAYVSTHRDIGLEVINISDPQNPFVERKIEISDGDVERIDIKEDLALVSSYWNGLYILDVSSPALPMVVDSLPSLGHMYDARFLGETISSAEAVATGDSILYLLDIDEVNPPSIIDSLILDDQIYGLNVSSNKIYVANRYSGLRIIEVTTGDSLEIAGHIDFGGNSRDVDVVNTKAYVASSEDSALYVFDVSNTNNIDLKYDFNLPGAKGVFATSEYIYLAGGRDGISVLGYR